MGRRYTVIRPDWPETGENGKELCGTSRRKILGAGCSRNFYKACKTFYKACKSFYKACKKLPACCIFRWKAWLVSQNRWSVTGER